VEAAAWPLWPVPKMDPNRACNGSTNEFFGASVRGALGATARSLSRLAAEKFWQARVLSNRESPAALAATVWRRFLVEAQSRVAARGSYPHLGDVDSTLG
jgi:hypothetical protein